MDEAQCLNTLLPGASIKSYRGSESNLIYQLDSYFSFTTRHLILIVLTFNYVATVDTRLLRHCYPSPRAAAESSSKYLQALDRPSTPLWQFP